jgi:dihydroceramidase
VHGGTIMAPVKLAAAHGEMLIFEEPAAYHENNNRPGFWGPPASSIDWCERNYAVSFFIAEWWNTLSNVGQIVLGVWGLHWVGEQRLERRFTLVYASMIFVGVGSTAFHGTLTHIGQQGDETPMVIGLSLWLYVLACLNPSFEAKQPRIAALAKWMALLQSLVFAVLHYVFSFVVFFQSLIGLQVIVGVAMVLGEYKRCSDPGARRLVHGYLLTWLVAFPVWLIDQHLCAQMYKLPHGLPNPQLHAWWHVFMSVNCYIGPVFCIFRRQQMRGLEARVCYTFGVLPHVDSRRPSRSD